MDFRILIHMDFRNRFAFVTKADSKSSCNALHKLYCQKDGRCKFFKTQEQVNNERLINLIKKRRK